MAPGDWHHPSLTLINNPILITLLFDIAHMLPLRRLSRAMGVNISTEIVFGVTVAPDLGARYTYHRADHCPADYSRVLGAPS